MTETLSNDEIEALVSQSQTNNSANNVTGLLFFDNHRFIQIIEGPETAITDLYKTLETDTRHKDVTLLHQVEINQRSFGNWDMAYEPLPLQDFETLGIIKNSLNAREALQVTKAPHKSFGTHLFGVLMGSTLTLS